MFDGAHRNGNSVAVGVLTDAVYGGLPTAGNATGLSLTTAWGVNAAYSAARRARQAA